jgi:hypothetical protein
MREVNLAEIAQITAVLDPATDAAGRTGRYVRTREAHKMTFVFNILQGNAATIALSCLQATSAAGAGAKACTTSHRWWACLDVATTDLLVRQADGLSFTTDAGVKTKVVICEVDPTGLDMAGGFLYVAPVTGASNAANLTSAIAAAFPLRFAQAQPPSIRV